MRTKNGYQSRKIREILACPGYPECNNAEPYYESADVDCPKCGGKVLKKEIKKEGHITDVNIIRV